MDSNTNANKGPGIMVEVWTLLTFALLILSLRLACRKITKMGLWWDDYLIIISLVVCTVDAVFATLGTVKYGLGKHIEVVGAEAAVGYVKMLLAQEFCYMVVLFTTKLSIILYFWRIFKVTTIKWSLYVLSTILILWFLVTLIITIAQCQPLDAMWYPEKGHCLNGPKAYLGNAIPNIVTDFLLILTPIPYIVKLHLKTWQKIGLILAFALGSLVTVISIIRLLYAVVRFNPGPEITWNYVPIVRWTVAEIYLAPTAACLPSLGPLVRRRPKSERPAHNVNSPDKEGHPSNARLQAGKPIQSSTRVIYGLPENKGFRQVRDAEDYATALRDMSA